jgi:hypothetical protein
MSESLFLSGPWTGFYNYHPGDRHRMDLQLTFANGNLAGDGADDVGQFLIKGRYDAASHECYWTKSYLGAHDVFYRGFREGKGIWGTWEITIHDHGGFHIWPQQAGEGDTVAAAAASAEPVDAIATQEATSGAVQTREDGALGSPILTQRSRAGQPMTPHPP